MQQTLDVPVSFMPRRSAERGATPPRWYHTPFRRTRYSGTHCGELMGSHRASSTGVSSWLVGKIWRIRLGLTGCADVRVVISAGAYSRLFCRLRRHASTASSRYAGRLAKKSWSRPPSPSLLRLTKEDRSRPPHPARFVPHREMKNETPSHFASAGATNLVPSPRDVDSDTNESLPSVRSIFRTIAPPPRNATPPATP